MAGVAYAPEAAVNRLMSEVKLLRQNLRVLRQRNVGPKELRERAQREVTSRIAAMPGVAIDQRSQSSVTWE